MPDTVRQLMDPLRRPLEKPLPLPRLFPRLRRTLRDALRWEERAEQPFFRDTDLTLKLRTFYYNRDTNKVNAADSINEAWALGGSLAYQAGWYKDFLSIGAEVFTSQKLYGPRDRDGTLLLRPGQQEYTVIGQAYAHLQYKENQVMLYRQYFDLPYINKQDNRMTPNTFEGYRLYRQTSQFRYVVGYIDKIKRRDSSTFISMSEAAGAPANRKRGLLLAGAAYVPSDNALAGVVNYIVPDVLNILYAEMNYTWIVNQDLQLKLSAQFTDQRSVG
jgi:outer membrane porin, OprD family